MKTLFPLNYEKEMGPEFTAPLDFIPDPSFPGASLQQIEWYYKICKLVMDEAILTHAGRLYIQQLILTIERFPENPTNPQVNQHIKMISTLAYEIGLSLEQIQKAGIPIFR